MNKFILGILFVAIGLGACNTPNQNEIKEVEALIAKVDSTEKALLSLDTAKIFGTKRQLATDIKEFERIKDTLTREEAFRVADYFGSKKKFYRLSARYPQFIADIELSKKQLNNLKQDLENDLVKKDYYSTYYADEHSAFKDLEFQVNKLVTGIDVVVDKYETDRPKLLELMEELKQKSANNE